MSSKRVSEMRHKRKNTK